MGELKSIRHEHFVRELIRTGGNATEAYRRVSVRFPNKPLLNPMSAEVIACNIRKRPEVQRREMELRAIMAKKSDITMDKVLTDIETAISMAKEQGKANEVINGAMSQAKVVGLLRDRVEAGNVGDFDNVEDMSELLARVGEEAGPEAALALSKALGLDKAAPSPEPIEDDGLAKAISPSDAVN